jgi:hypothetical protein
MIQYCKKKEVAHIDAPRSHHTAPCGLRIFRFGVIFLTATPYPSSDREFKLFPLERIIIRLYVEILKDLHRRNFFFIKGEPNKTPHFRQ